MEGETAQAPDEESKAEDSEVIGEQAKLTPEEEKVLTKDVLEGIWGAETISEDDIVQFQTWFPDWNAFDFKKNQQEVKPVVKKQVDFVVEPDGILKITWTADLLVPTQTKKGRSV